MKRLLILLILCFLLGGCTVYDPQQTDFGNFTAESTGQTDAPTTPNVPGIYDPESTVEQLTGGAVRVYPTGKSVCRGVCRWGGDILLFSVEDSSDPVVTLTLLTAESLHPVASIKLDCAITPLDPGFHVTDTKLGFYHAASGSMVFLDKQLQEVNRVALPQGIDGEPILSSDLKTVYYCSGLQIRALDLETGISRLLKEYSGGTQSIRSLCFGDSMLVCDVLEADGDSYLGFVSTQSGQMVGSDSAILDFYGGADNYLLKRTEGNGYEYLFGTVEQQVNAFYPSRQDMKYVWLPEINSVVTQTRTDEGGLFLELYDLNAGTRSAGVTLPGMEQAYSIFSDGEYVWFAAYDSEKRAEILYRWEPGKSALGDTNTYTSVRYTAQAPDLQGMAACRSWADTLEETHGVQIHFEAADLPAVQEHVLTGEYQIAAIRSGMTQLEAALSAFPEGFFKRLASVTADGAVHISIVRGISGERDAMQYWDGGNAHIVLAIEEGMVQRFYHEIYYVVDTFLMSNSSILDKWSDLNPWRFDYDYNYEDYLDRVDQKYLTGKDRAFIDPYSMTFPKEDRARIFEYAMLPGCEVYFEADTMEDKLEMLCDGIRDAFDWKRSDAVFLWEQYL